MCGKVNAEIFHITLQAIINMVL